ncbi:MAG: DsbA family protein [Thermoleophilaceae bacterium]|nr:DsbA family protein [Thermoleophilaceae bacterium]
MRKSAPEIGGPEASERPIFYFDFSSPECWLAAERVNHELPVVPVWTPVRVSGSRGSPSTEELVDLDRRGAAPGLPAIRLPDPWPDDLDLALRAATFAAASGRVVAFSLAALRQAFAAGRDLSEVDNVLIAAAACELHPRAVLKGIESRSTAERLRAASAEAAERGVREVPALVAHGCVLQGSAAVGDATPAARYLLSVARGEIDLDMDAARALHEGRGERLP